MPNRFRKVFKAIAGDLYAERNNPSLADMSRAETACQLAIDAEFPGGDLYPCWCQNMDQMIRRDAA